MSTKLNETLSGVLEIFKSGQVEELILCGVELDLYCRPEKIGAIRARHEPDALYRKIKSPSQAATQEGESINPQQNP